MTYRAVLASVVLLLLGACQSAPTRAPIALAPQVDLQRFMGDWYVIAAIPTWLEREAYDAVERYERRADGRIQTIFSYRDGSFDAPLKTMRPVGTVVDTRSNAVWTMQFLWPFEADYRIVHVDPAHREVIIGRDKRDYVWIMARTPQIAEADYQRLVALVAAQGYDATKLRRVPQKAGGRG